MNKKGKIIGLSLVAIMVVSLFAAAIPSITADGVKNGDIPDLVITDIWTVGNRIHYTIENIGGEPAPISYTGLYINGIYRSRDKAPALGPGAKSDEVFGRYDYRGGDIEVCADYRHRVDELDENNNCNVLGPEPMPDLIITEKNETALGDCRFNVTYTVENIGNGDANASNTTIWIGGVDEMEEMEDPVPALVAGDHYTNTVGPFNCTPCQLVQVVVEADNDKNVTESNEDNNERVNVFKCPGPDLTITYKHETPLDNCSFTVTYTVENIGNCKANASNTTIWIGGVDEMEDPVPELAAGDHYTNTVGPFNCTPCQPVQVKVEADNNDNVTECDESNNEETNTYVCPGPDLIISDKYETVQDNCSFTVTYTVENIGECNASASNTTIYINDVEQMKDPVPELAKDDTYTSTVGPFNCAPCTTLKIAVKADNDDDVVECGECNNWKINEFKCPAPDLVISAKTEEINEDNCTFTVTYTVENIGNCKANASDTTIWIDGINKWEDPVPELDKAGSCGDSYENTVGPFSCEPCTTLNITVEADNNHNVTECNESNNVMENEFKCPAPDLTITDSYGEVLDNCSFTATYTVENIGNCKANASETTIYINGVEVSEDPVPALAAGEPYTNTVGPFSCAPCTTFTVKVKADNKDNVTECNESNNVMENEDVCPGPDLIIADKHETALDNCSFTVTYTVKNIGECNASASETTIYINGVNVLEDPVGELAAGGTYTSTVGPFGCTSCDILNITVEADNNGDVTECNETNNNKTNTYVCPGPDLIVFDKYETPLGDGSFNVTYTVKNIGDCNAGASNTTITVDGTATEYPAPALSSDQCYTDTVGPFNCEPCMTVTVTVKADNNDDVTECNETNNEKTNTFVCPGPGPGKPDLVITDCWSDGNRIRYTIKNIGGEPAPASYTGLYINGIYRSRDKVDPLAPGEESIGEVFGRYNYRGGDIEVCADYRDRVDEANEGNNCCTVER